MLTTIYKIESVYDKKGNKKENKYRLDRWFIKGVFIGGRAFLINLDDDNKTLLTSEVEDIKILDNAITITTYDFVYHLKPYVQGV